MFGRVLIGYDGSESGRDAVAFGEALAKPMGAELALGRVFAWKPVRDPLREVPHLRGKREEDERKAVQQLQSAASSSSGRPVVVANDDVALGLEELAADLGAGLIVVGSSSRGRPHSALAGNVGQRLLHGSPCPVAVAPQRFRHRYAPDIRTIAIGYDGSSESAAALPAVGELARLLGAGLRVIVVQAGDEDRRPERRLAEALAALPADIERSGCLLAGEPAPVLLHEAARDADLLVVGSRGQGPLRRALFGSVSSVLVREAPCPVLVFPRGARTAAEELSRAAAVTH